MLDLLFLGIALPSFAYLAYRAGDVALRQLRSYQAIPFASGAFAAETGDTYDDHAFAALVGVALGDALGMPRESLPVWLTQLRFGAKPTLRRGILRVLRRRGTISDDTQLTIAVAKAIRDDGSFDAETFERELADWWRIRIGPGRATCASVERLMNGDSAPGDRNSQGNGAAMRVVPLAIAYVDDLEAMLDAVRNSSRPTHADAEAIAGAEVAGRATRLLLRGEPLEVVSLLPRASSENIERWEKLLSAAKELAESGDDGLDELGTTGWVFHTIPSVLYLFWRWPNDFEQGLSALFRAGGDVDTVAALYGALVGASGGMDAFGDLPWQEVQGAGVLQREAGRLAALT
ncbi:hypothetical protein FIV42_24895 [Persicimonas caeni]|uniref:ADP-ribosylglycohydrolase family protein n=1 Tax=Persicimonas caeni TaxID=2292766 RepID=A0A4Y6Q010_PERCE|nr:ADP-ribosylglycohydrolase family protein [Persicimonas caeni]QDG53862.1 hypothetical protein FIV42_24895 [Persicimonas caeni]QED35083.1 hypothetical protein FRD00_24890 [Persicimonas caeni]